MNLKLKRNINEPCNTNISVAVSQITKQKADALKLSYKIDLNQMIREYIDQVFDAAKKGQNAPGYPDRIQEI